MVLRNVSKQRCKLRSLQRPDARRLTSDLTPCSIGLLLAAAEAIFRLKDGIFSVKPADEMTFPPSLYGAPLGLVAELLLAKYTDLIRDIPIPVEGFYSKGFDDKRERERRYGNVYTVED